MRHLEHADGGEDERARQSGAEELDGRVSHRDVVQHARHDPPALERGAVLPHRLLRARSARDVRERLGGHHVLSTLLEALDRHRDPRARAAGASDVHLELALAADADRWPALGGHSGTLELGRNHGKAL